MFKLTKTKKVQAPKSFDQRCDAAVCKINSAVADLRGINTEMSEKVESINSTIEGLEVRKGLLNSRIGKNEGLLGRLSELLS